jgi:signal transduction histidine kinase
MISQRIDPEIARKISRLYLLALTAVALLSVGGQVLVQRSLKSQLSDARVINIAGRQRMLSQKICKTLLLLDGPHSGPETSAYVAELEDALALWGKCHTGLRKGYLEAGLRKEYSEDIRTPVHNSAAIRRMFAEIDPLFERMYAHASTVRRLFRETRPIPTAGVSDPIQAVLRDERAYLQGMNRIVFQYDAEAGLRVNASRRIEYILLLVTLLVLLLEGVFIFRPAVNQIRQTIFMLLSSRQQLQQANEELVRVNQSLATTREALVEAVRQKHRRQINEQKLRSAYLIEGQEEERKRVAREIHDGLGQMLTALKYGIEKMGDAVPETEASRRHLDDLRQLVSQTMTEARAISFNLMPAVLSDFGISSALKMLASQVASATGTHITFVSGWNGQRLPKNIEVGLYRVGQEAIHNAVKYAGAQEIRLELTDKKKFIHLEITDKGRGFDYKKKLPTGERTDMAQGISNMKERVFLMNGQIDIISKPGQGTRIHIKVPVTAQAIE